MYFAFHVKRYKLACFYLKASYSLSWLRQPKNMIKQVSMHYILGYSGLQRKQFVPSKSWQEDVAIEKRFNRQPQSVTTTLKEAAQVQCVSESWQTHQVFHCSLCAECCFRHRGCWPEHHTPDSSSASLNHHRLTTATRPSSHLNTDKRTINTNPDKHKAGRPGNQRAHPSCHHPRPLTFPTSQTDQTHQKVFVM